MKRTTGGTTPDAARTVETASRRGQDDLHALTEATLSHGLRAHPQLLVSRDVLTQHLAFALDGTSVAQTKAAQTLHLEDLYLACACAQKMAAALSRFEETCSASIGRHLSSLNYQGVDEIRQCLRQHLFVGTATSPPRIRQYSGRAPLAAWAGVVARRLALSMRRVEGARNRTKDALVAQAIAAVPDPEINHLKADLRPHFVAAMKDALGCLSPRDRGLLKMQIVGGMSMETLGALHSVNGSTVFRWLRAAREQLRREALGLLKRRLGLHADEVESIMRLVPSDIDASVSQILA